MINEDKDLLIRLLAQANESENAIRNTTRTTMNFYSTLLLSLTGGIFIISKDLKGHLFDLCFIIGGFFLLVIPIMAFFHYKSDYCRQIEQITIQAKIEDILGLTDVNKYQTSYWNNEPIVPLLYVNTRNKYINSQDFVKSFTKATDMNYIRFYYGIFSFLGIVLMFYGLYKTFI